MSDAVLPANPKPCIACPWRTANQGRRHAHGFYAKSNLARLWSKIRRGERMTCHPTDSRMAEFEGYEAQAEIEDAHECTGSLVLVQRELFKFQFYSAVVQAAKSNANAMRIYRSEHKVGHTNMGMARHVSRLIPFPGELTMTVIDLHEHEDVSYEPLGDWQAWQAYHQAELEEHFASKAKP